MPEDQLFPDHGQDAEYAEHIDAAIQHCERCQEPGQTEAIPMHGFSLYLCRKCAAAAYRIGEAI